MIQSKKIKLHDETLQSKGDQCRGAWCIHLRTCQALSAAEWISFFGEIDWERPWWLEKKTNMTWSRVVCVLLVLLRTPPNSSKFPAQLQVTKGLISVIFDKKSAQHAEVTGMIMQRASCASGSRKIIQHKRISVHHITITVLHWDQS